MSISRFTAIKNIALKNNKVVFTVLGENGKIIKVNDYYVLYLSGKKVDTASNIDKFSYVLVVK